MKHTACFLLNTAILAPQSRILHEITYTNVNIVQQDGILDTHTSHDVDARADRYIGTNLKDAPYQQLYSLSPPIYTLPWQWDQHEQKDEYTQRQ